MFGNLCLGTLWVFLNEPLVKDARSRFVPQLLESRSLFEISIGGFVAIGIAVNDLLEGGYGILMEIFRIIAFTDPVQSIVGKTGFRVLFQESLKLLPRGLILIFLIQIQSFLVGGLFRVIRFWDLGFGSTLVFPSRPRWDSQRRLEPAWRPAREARFSVSE